MKEVKAFSRLRMHCLFKVKRQQQMFSVRQQQLGRGIIDPNLESVGNNLRS